MYKKIIGFHILTVLYIFLLGTTIIAIEEFPEGLMGKYNIEMIPMYYFEMAILVTFFICAGLFLITISREKKKNLWLDILTLDLPAVLEILWIKWRSILFNMVPWGSKYGRLRVYISDENLQIAIMTIGGLLLGLEIVRYVDYFKLRKKRERLYGQE